MRNPKEIERIQPWLDACLPGNGLACIDIECVRDRLEREVWICGASGDAGSSGVVLHVFKPGCLDTVNTSLPPAQAAAKCALAMSELPGLGIPTPRVLGHAVIGEQAAVLCERIDAVDWTADTRIEAAAVLARLHGLPEDVLSDTLRRLVRVSDPREVRTTGGEAPCCKDKRLVHGDYFSVNILHDGHSVRILDWETFGWGDPMWDLGFLVGADRGLDEEEISAVVAAYARKAPVDPPRLRWHMNRWSAYWRRRDAQQRQKGEEDRSED